MQSGVTEVHVLSLIIIHTTSKDDRIISDSYTITIRQTMIVNSEYRDTCQLGCKLH